MSEGGWKMVEAMSTLLTTQPKPVTSTGEREDLEVCVWLNWLFPTQRIDAAPGSRAFPRGSCRAEYKALPYLTFKHCLNFHKEHPLL